MFLRSNELVRKADSLGGFVDHQLCRLFWCCSTKQATFGVATAANKAAPNGPGIALRGAAPKPAELCSRDTKGSMVKVVSKGALLKPRKKRHHAVILRERGHHNGRVLLEPREGRYVQREDPQARPIRLHQAASDSKGGASTAEFCSVAAPDSLVAGMLRNTWSTPRADPVGAGEVAAHLAW